MAETLILAGLNSGIIPSAGAAVALGNAVSFGSLISTGLTAASAFGKIAGGYQESAIYKAQARQSELAAKAEELKGREQADKIRRSLQATLASQNAAFAARGISTTSGTPVKLGSVSSTEAARDIELAQFGGEYASATERAQANIYRMSGSAARTRGIAGAGFSLIGSRYA